LVNYEIKEGVLRIDCRNWVIPTSIEDSGATMATIIDILTKEVGIERIILEEEREIEYDYEQTKMLLELANLYKKVSSEQFLSLYRIVPKGKEKLLGKRISEMEFIITQLIRKDPIAAYVRVNQLIEQFKRSSLKEDIHFLTKILIPLKNLLENLSLIKHAKPYLKNYVFGDRSIYRKIFSPIIRPKFMLTRFILKLPKDSRLIERYRIGYETEVEIYKLPNSTRLFYKVIPPELKLKEDENEILQRAREYLAEHRPREEEVSDFERARELFTSLGRSLIRSLAKEKNLKLSLEEIELLTKILVRYTVGFGILEVLISDERLQDVYVNAPIGTTPIFVNHSDYGECETNVIPTRSEAEAWATRFRLYSGRPLDESNPVLDTEITLPEGRARVAIITKNLSLKGLAFAFRRHRQNPWTYPLFIKVKYFNPLYAGIMSFLVDGGRAILIAGSRGSGKTSLLNATMLELMRNTRIVVVEDTPELGIDLMRKLGYNIVSMKSRSVITQVQTELPPEEALRTALRLGDSVLIVGEVRSKESLALFEAMRIGALSNLVAGTIHGESAYGVYDRVVNDLGVVPTSFKALDIITIATFIKTPDGLRRFRRVVELTEVRKDWKEDPLQEEGFVKLMEYSAKEDSLKPTDVLLEGESQVLNEIAKRIREFRGNWDAVWDNILLRAKIKQTLVDYSLKLNRPEILEAKFTVEANEAFHLITNKVYEEVGLDNKRIYEEWLKWLKEKLRLR